MMGTSDSTIRELLAGLRHWLGRGRTHRRRLQEIDTRIAVSGVRGKTTLTRWLHECFSQRGYDTYSKTTGTEPLSWTNGTGEPIERSGRTTLYENEREISRHQPEDMLILENHGIREYTSRLVNSRYVDPMVLVLTNVRQDHLDTLGTTAREITQALARSVPAGTTVLTGEANPAVTDYLRAELEEREASLEVVDVPDAFTDVPGAENVFLLDAVLAAVGEAPIPVPQRQTYLDELRVEWTALANGRVYNAAELNDVDSTELVRQALTSQDGGLIQPLVCLRRDRPGRTRSFIEYLNRLYEQGAIDQVRVVGDHLEIFEYRTICPTVRHEKGREPPADVLDAALEDGQAVMLMGNAATPFMETMGDVIEERAVAVQAGAPSHEPQPVSVLRVAASHDSVAPSAVLESIDTSGRELDRLLVVSSSGEAAAPIEKWDSFGTREPAQYTRIAIGERLRSARGTNGGVVPLPGDTEIVALGDPLDLEALRERITDWIEAGVPDDEAAVVVPSLNWLIEQLGAEAIHAFLEELVAILTEAGVHVVVRLERTDMDTTRLEEVFDSLERTGDGGGRIDRETDAHR